LKNGVFRVPDLMLLSTLISTMLLPIAGGSTLLMAKLAHGESAPVAHRRFFVCLVVTTIVTLRTVVSCDDAWLIHTVTLASLIVGALAIPDHQPALAN